MTKVANQIAAKATDSPPGQEGMGALPADLTELSLADLMTLQVRGQASSDSGAPGVIDGLQATDALPADLTSLDLADLMTLKVAGKTLSESEETEVAGLSRNEDLPNDLTKLGLAELMTLPVRAGDYEDLPEDLTKLGLAGLMALRVRPGVYEVLPEDLTILDIADLMTLGVSARPPEDEKDKESEDDGQILELAAIEDEPVGEDEDVAKDDGDSNQTATQSSGGQFTEVELALLVDESLIRSASEDEVTGGDGLDGDGLVTDIAVPENFDSPEAGQTVTQSNGGSFTYVDLAPLVDESLLKSASEDELTGGGGGDTATVTVTVSAVNDAPVAGADAVSTSEDTALVISAAALLANDSDVDLDTLSVQSFTQGANGAVVDNGDGTYTYTPNLCFTGTDTFTYTISDGQGGTDTATVTVYVVTGIMGTSGDDSLNGTPGVDIMFGLGGNDTIQGLGANDTLYGGAGDDLLKGLGGSDILYGEAGNDTITFDVNDAIIDGGSGTDTLESSGDVNLTTFAGTITGIEVIDVSAPGQDQITLTAQDVLDISDTDTLRVVGSASDIIDAGAAWTDGGIAGGFHVYTQGLATLNVDTDITINADILI